MKCGTYLRRLVVKELTVGKQSGFLPLLSHRNFWPPVASVNSPLLDIGSVCLCTRILSWHALARQYESMVLAENLDHYFTARQKCQIIMSRTGRGRRFAGELHARGASWTGDAFGWPAEYHAERRTAVGFQIVVHSCRFLHWRKRHLVLLAHVGARQGRSARRIPRQQAHPGERCAE